MPQANRLTIHILAAVAEHEREMISQRTKAALAAAKARGVKLGNPNGARALVGRRGGAKGVARLKAKADAHAANILSVIEAIRAEGKASMNAIAVELNKRGILTPNGGQWWATSVRNLLNRAPEERVSPSSSLASGKGILKTGDASQGRLWVDTCHWHPGVSTVRYPIRQRTFKYVATVQSVTDETVNSCRFCAMGAIR